MKRLSNEPYKTRDFYLAAFFLAKGMEFEVEDAGNGIKYFVFGGFNDGDRETMIADFYRDEFIHKYITAIKAVKKRMYEGSSPVVYNRK